MSLFDTPTESVSLYGNTVTYGGTYFEWFIFQESATQPSTPTGGSWNFLNNTGTTPSGWSTVPPEDPTDTVWACIAIVNSRDTLPLVWSDPASWVKPGTPGDSATVTVGTTTTGAAGSSASVTNSGTTSAAILNFTIPRGDTGAAGAAGATGAVGVNWLGAWNSSTTYAVRDAVSYNGSSFYAIASNTNQTPAAGAYWDVLAEKGASGSGAGTVTSVDVSGGSTGLTTSGGPVTSSGTITLAGTLAVANGGTGATTAGGALTNLGAVGSVASADGSVTVSTVGSAVDLSVATAASTTNVLTQVRNTTGATLTKGTVVYMSGATGQIPTVSKALATSDATSAQTLGMMTADLANNSNGYVTVIGLIQNIDTSAYTDGAQLYLSGSTAGTVTTTKPYAPIHLVYVGVVEYAHPTQGKIFVKVQNGYELDELHNVSAQTPTNGQTIVYNSSTSLWEQNTVSLTNGVNGTLPVGNGGTGLASFTAGDLPYYASGTALSKLGIGTSGYVITSSGTAPQWSNLASIAVTTISGGTTGLTPSSSTAGAVTLAGTLNVANGGSGATALTGVLKGNGTSAFTAATAGTDYVDPATATTFTATQTFSGSSSVKAMKTSNIAEVDTISATAATGTINYDITTQSVLYYSSNASANWTVNFRGSSGTSLNTLMATGECISATFLVTQGSTAYYNSAVTIDGTSVTPKWQGGTAPTSGNANSVDCYTYVIQKTGSATFAVLASQTKFA